VEEYFRNKHLGVELILSFEEKRMGTAGALKLAEKYFSDCENFFMCNGDEVKNVDYSELLRMHEKNSAIASIALYAIGDVSQYGVVKLDGEKIIEFVEKPSRENAPSNLISSGAYVLSKKVFDYIPSEKEVSIEKDVFTVLAEEGKLFGKETVSSFLTIDTPERYHKTVKEFK
jgi:mannose-1-phosphate guanylyltransferase